MPNLFASGLFSMVIEHLQKKIHPKDFVNGFPQLFQLCFHILQGHIPHRIAHVFGTAYLLTMTKPSHGVCPIVMGEVLYQLTNHTLCL
jgi:hypothetical protein